MEPLRLQCNEPAAFMLLSIICALGYGNLFNLSLHAHAENIKKQIKNSTLHKSF